MNVAKLGKKLFWAVLIVLGAYAITLILGLSHLVKNDHDHETWWFGYYRLCDKCECWVHEDCWPGKE